MQKYRNISYNFHHDLENRSIADKILREDAIDRMKASDPCLSEKNCCISRSVSHEAKGKSGTG